MKLYQVRILTDDFERSFRFYTQTLGLHLAWGDIEGPYAAVTGDGNASVAIFERAAMAEAVGGIDFPHKDDRAEGSPMIVLQVDSVDSLYDKLSRTGSHFENRPRDYPDWTIRAVHLRDPDGVLIEFFEPLPEEKWTSWVREKNAQAAGSRRSDTEGAGGNPPP